MGDRDERFNYRRSHCVFICGKVYVPLEKKNGRSDKYEFSAYSIYDMDTGKTSVSTKEIYIDLPVNVKIDPFNLPFPFGTLVDEREGRIVYTVPEEHQIVIFNIHTEEVSRVEYEHGGLTGRDGSYFDKNYLINRKGELVCVYNRRDGNFIEVVSLITGKILDNPEIKKAKWATHVVGIEQNSRGDYIIAWSHHRARVLNEQFEELFEFDIEKGICYYSHRCYKHIIIDPFDNIYVQNDEEREGRKISLYDPEGKLLREFDEMDNFFKMAYYNNHLYLYGRDGKFYESIKIYQ